jgi:hypothetical protein
LSESHGENDCEYFRTPDHLKRATSKHPHRKGGRSCPAIISESRKAPIRALPTPPSTADDNAAWKEMTIVCGDLAGDIARGLKPGTNWQMELLDAERKVVFRIHIAAEATV